MVLAQAGVIVIVFVVPMVKVVEIAVKSVYPVPPVDVLLIVPSCTFPIFS